ncbi:hypothetical protein L916_12275 [Phytophthora nicotianae]|uniref:ABC transporter domain-containing protein n=1 Tax=Phytophthora nicotianae TaxID=4792 RepID=W2IQJ2_PHYNI|nr:hypothetical protein L916_12275 [Phytophthora nicotianae]
MPTMDNKLSKPSPPDLSKRRTTWTFIRALMWKNWTIKNRQPIATTCEILVPTFFILLLGFLKLLTTSVDVPPGWSDDADNTAPTRYNLFQPTGTSINWVDADLPKFAQHESTLTGLILKLGLQSINDGMRLAELSSADLVACKNGVLIEGYVDANVSSIFRVLPECAEKVSPYKIAIAPDNTFTRKYFMETMELWYPRKTLGNSSASSLTIPSFKESVQFFASDEALTDYIKSDEYGKGLDNPRIYAGIVFESIPSDEDIGSFASIEYSLRLNSTRGRIGEAVGRVASTGGSVEDVSPFQKDIVTDYYSRYAVTGFMTLQTLVTRFVTCMPEWISSNESVRSSCQSPQATALPSIESDDNLLNALGSDGLIKEFIQALGMGNTTAVNILSQTSVEAKELLLVPLRQAPQSVLGSVIAPFPIDSYTSSPFYDQVSEVFSIMFIMAYLFTLSRLLVVLIEEKELRLREFMKILGVTEKVITMTWYVTYAVILFIGAAVQALAGLAGLFPNSSVLVTFLFFFLKARVGVFVGMVVFFLMYAISQGFSDETSEGVKTIGSVLSPVALSFGVTVLASAEETGDGVRFSNMNTLSNNFRISTALWMFALDTVLYTILGLYFERIIPKQYGTTLKWYFPVSPSYWRKRNQKNVFDQAQDALLENVSLDVNPNFEPVSSELREQEISGDALCVQRLRKVFDVPGGEKVAVKGLNLVMYRDQITCLLGHNGAGKTTLISMLTGMTAPSSGNASFQGMTLTDDMDDLRQSLGLCFQHDALFPELTVQEHLLFFGQIKGYSSDKLPEVVEKQIQEVGLTEKRHAKPNDLSGGMKRKLSVAISLLGDSALVFLDEPTSGMDPYSRRSVWDILQNNRNGRLMVLTTHFMDEADILGDRIASMAEGELRCSGSSLFLKNRFEAGYNLTVVKDDERCDDKELVAFISSYVPTSQVLSNVGSEIAFQLSLDSSPLFAEMFAELDRQSKQLGVLSYGVSVTTLEEVFIKVAELDDENHQHTLQDRLYTNTSESGEHYEACDEIIMGRPTFTTHLRALILKRFRYAKRDKKTIVYVAALPILLIAAGLGIFKASMKLNDDPFMALTTDVYYGNSTPTPYFCISGSSEGWCDQVMTTFFSGADTQELSIAQPAFDSDSPTVFDVTYTNPKINATGATGYGLALGQKLYNRGYGYGSELVEGQFGSYLLYGDSTQNLFGYNLFTNTTGAHSSAVFKALMDEATYRFFATNSTGAVNSTVSLKVNSHPLPFTAASESLFSTSSSFVASLFICIAFTFLPASIVVFLVKEKESAHNAKHQQLVSGVSLPAFWLSNYIWDLLMYTIPCVATLVLLNVFNISALTGTDCSSCTGATFPSVILLFVLFGLAICPFSYALSFLFKEHASAQTYTIVLNFVIGMVLMITSFILDLIDSTEGVNSVLKFFWRFSPLFSLGNALLNMVNSEFDSIRSSDDGGTSPFDPDMMGFEMIYLVFTIVFFFGLTLHLDYAKAVKKTDSLESSNENFDPDYEVDEDVRQEALRVASGGADHDAVKLKELRKVYPGGKVAVRNLSFGLKRGECFGFLGINGAGKTTTMKMLTGDVIPTQGSATLGGFDILTQQADVRRQIGYCPQFDALFDLLSVREHLELFGAIKGVPISQLDAVVQDKILQLNLSDFEHKLAGSLSGGNKRKLSVAIAMIGNPAIIFLDEPSTGIDPVSRRFMWDVIADISTRGKESTIVLTTHSMEECEALCSTVGIMVGGRLRCLGSVQHLKSRFGDGLMIDVKLETPSTSELDSLVDRVFGLDNMHIIPADIEERCRDFGNADLATRITSDHPTGFNLAAASRNYLVGSFDSANVVVLERQNDFCRLKITESGGKVELSRMFALVEQVKSKMHIREYSVSQTTLEQIFNSFASQQEEELGVARGMTA